MGSPLPAVIWAVGWAHRSAFFGVSSELIWAVASERAPPCALWSADKFGRFDFPVSDGGYQKYTTRMLRNSATPGPLTPRHKDIYQQYLRSVVF